MGFDPERKKTIVVRLLTQTAIQGGLNKGYCYYFGLQTIIGRWIIPLCDVHGSGIFRQKRR